MGDILGTSLLRHWVPSMQIFYSELALKDTKERLFPVSRHRSARIRKKMIKRYGGEFRKVPCIWKTPHGIVMHPALKDDFERALEAKEVG